MSHLVPTRAKVLTSLSLLCSINATSDGLRKCRVSRQETRPRVKTRANRAYNCKRQKTAVAQARCSTRRARGTRATSAARQPNSHTQCSTLSNCIAEAQHQHQPTLVFHGRPRQTDLSLCTLAYACAVGSPNPDSNGSSKSQHFGARHKRSSLRADNKLHM